jgi:hypothetical protein
MKLPGGESKRHRRETLSRLQGLGSRVHAVYTNVEPNGPISAYQLALIVF